jgi:hypothetical protein
MLYLLQTTEVNKQLRNQEMHITVSLCIQNALKLTNMDLQLQKIS